jgi:hypothetical protein
MGLKIYIWCVSDMEKVQNISVPFFILSILSVKNVILALINIIHDHS